MNPYQEWLGRYDISGMTKPNYYELLGLQFGESNIYQIEQAANEMATRLNSINPGPNLQLWNSLMSDIQSARTCLCNPASRMEYDNSLRGGGFGGGYSAAGAFGGGMGYQAPPAPAMPLQPGPSQPGGFGGGYSAGNAFGQSAGGYSAGASFTTPPVPGFGASASPSFGAPAVPGAAPIPGSTGYGSYPPPPVPSAPVPTAPIPSAPMAATPIRTAVPVAAAATVATAATVAAVAKPVSAASVPPTPKAPANVNFESANSHKKRPVKKNTAVPPYMYAIYGAFAFGGLIFLLMLSQLYKNITKDDNPNVKTAIVTPNDVSAPMPLPRQIDKDTYTGEKIKPVAVPDSSKNKSGKNRLRPRRTADGILVRDTVGDEGDNPDITELGVSGDGVVVERDADFRPRVVDSTGAYIDGRDPADSVEEALDHTLGIDIAPNEDGEGVDDIHRDLTDTGVVDTLDQGHTTVIRDGGHRDGTTVIRHGGTDVVGDGTVVVDSEPSDRGSTEQTPADALGDNSSALGTVDRENQSPFDDSAADSSIGDSLVIESDVPDSSNTKEATPESKSESKEEAKEQPKPESKEEVKEQPKPESKDEAKEQPKPESKEEVKEQPKPEPKDEAKEQPKPEPKEEAKEQPKPEPKEEAKEQPKPEPKEEAKEQPKPAPVAKVAIPKESDQMAAEAKIKTDNSDVFKSKDAAVKTDLAQKLLDKAGTEESAIDKYAMLNSAQSLAMDAKQIPVAIKTVRAKTKGFDGIDAYQEAVDVLLSSKPAEWPVKQWSAEDKKMVLDCANGLAKRAQKNNKSREVKKLQEVINAVSK